MSFREVRAAFDDRSIVVYQAYSDEIADAAIAAGRFVPPFKRDRMTWIKPSFLWMMYRCGWATKPGQQRVLAVRMTCEGFESALARACLSHYDDAVYADETSWSSRRDSTDVRVQWDPERSLRLEPLPHRSLQVGLGGRSAHAFVDDWCLAVDDVTGVARTIASAVDAGDEDGARRLLPPEAPYPLPADVAAVIGATPS